MPERFRPLLPYLLGASVLLLIVLSSWGSYRVGYARGSGVIVSPPQYLTILNPASTGEFSILPDDTGATVNFGNFWKTWHILDRNFVPSSTTTSTTTADAHLEGAIEGLVQSYGDPYTIFLPKEKSAAFKEQVDAEFQGIGAVLAQTDTGLTFVTAILKDSPAFRAGLKPGSRITMVDGASIAGQDLSSVVARIRGPKETTVSLTVIPQNSQKEATLPITRGIVVIPTTATRVVAAAKDVIVAAAAQVIAAAQAAAASLPGPQHDAQIDEAKQKAAAIAQQKFFVLQLATFAKTSTDAFVKDLGGFAHSNTKNLIIDLRNNPGGYLDVAVDLASYFVPKDGLIVSEHTGTNGDVTNHVSLGHPLLDSATSTRRMVVLLNRNSASASEILAGALQDHHLAKVVGETSYGKGSVQTVVDIGDVGSLKITIARWYTPSGKNISHTGIAPDVAVDIKDPRYASSTDPYMDAAVQTLLDDSLWK